MEKNYNPTMLWLINNDVVTKKDTIPLIDIKNLEENPLCISLYKLIDNKKLKTITNAIDKICLLNKDIPEDLLESLQNLHDARLVIEETAYLIELANENNYNGCKDIANCFIDQIIYSCPLVRNEIKRQTVTTKLSILKTYLISFIVEFNMLSSVVYRKVLRNLKRLDIKDKKKFEVISTLATISLNLRIKKYSKVRSLLSYLDKELEKY